MQPRMAKEGLCVDWRLSMPTIDQHLDTFMDPSPIQDSNQNDQCAGWRGGPIVDLQAARRSGSRL